MIIENFFDYNTHNFDYLDVKEDIYYFDTNRYEFFIYRFLRKFFRRRRYIFYTAKKKSTIRFYSKLFRFIFIHLTKVKLYKLRFITKKNYFHGQFNIIFFKIINKYSKYIKYNVKYNTKKTNNIYINIKKKINGYYFSVFE